MKSLFEKPAAEELLIRLENVMPQTQRQWGKMTVEQMFAHCSAGLDMAAGREVPPFSLIGRIVGRFLKDMYSNDRPFGKGSPTSLKTAGNLDFATEKKRLIEIISRFNQDGLAGVTSKPHPFFGKLAPEAWGKGMYKHIDHHFKQFGV